VTCMDQFASSLGHRRIRLRTDGEPSILKVARHSRELRNDTSLEQAPRYSRQSLGGVGRFQRQVMEDVVTLRYSLESRFGMPITPQQQCWPRLAPHAAWAANRFATRVNNRIAFENAFDMSYRGVLVRFAECVFYKEPSSSTGRLTGHRRACTADRQWHRGVWLGAQRPATSV